MAKKLIKATNNSSYQLIGLKTISIDYKIAWQLNSSIFSDFKKDDNLDLYTTSTPSKIIFWENSSKKTFLRELSQFNFILKVFMDKKDTEETIKKIFTTFKNEIISIIDKTKLTKKSQTYINKLDF